MNQLIRFSIQQRFFVMILAVLLFGVGIYNALQLPIDAVPDVTNKQECCNRDNHICHRTGQFLVHQTISSKFNCGFEEPKQLFFTSKRPFLILTDSEVTEHTEEVFHFLGLSWNQKRISTSNNDLQWWRSNPWWKQMKLVDSDRFRLWLAWSSTMIDSSIEKSFVVDFQVKSRFNQWTLTTSNDQSEKWKCQSTTNSSFSLQLEEKIDFIHLARRSERTNRRILFFSQKISRSTKVSFTKPVLSLLFIGKNLIRIFLCPSKRLTQSSDNSISFIDYSDVEDSLQIISTTNASRRERREEKASSKMIQLNHSRISFSNDRLILFLSSLNHEFFPNHQSITFGRREWNSMQMEDLPFTSVVCAQSIFIVELTYRYVLLFARIMHGDSKDSKSRESHSENTSLLHSMFL